MTDLPTSTRALVSTLTADGRSEPAIALRFEDSAGRPVHGAAMIDVTATMLPSTVRNDRSLLDQIACKAMLAAS